METQTSLASASTAASTSLDSAEVPIRPGFACNHCSKAKRKCSGTDGTVACVQCAKRNMNETCKPVSTRRRFTGMLCTRRLLCKFINSGFAAPKKNKKTRSSDEWLAPRAKRADFKPASKTKRKSASSGQSGRALKSSAAESAEWKMRSAGTESRKAHTASSFQDMAAFQPQFGDARYAPYLGFPPGHRMSHQSGFGGGFMPAHAHAAGAGAAPQYPVYSHMANAAAWQPTAHSGFGGDMHFAYRSHQDMYERSAAVDSLASMGAERTSRLLHGSMQQHNWTNEPLPGAYQRDVYSAARGYMADDSRQHAAPRRYSAGTVSAPPAAHNDIHAAAAGGMPPHWGGRSASATAAMPGAAYGSNPMLL